MTTLYKYRLRCVIENAYKYVWESSDNPIPTLCPTDSSHTVDTSVTAIVGEISKNTTKIEEETVPTGGHFRSETVEYNITAVNGNTQVITKTWDYPVNIIVLKMITLADNIGDTITIYVGKDTVVGAITSAVTNGDTVINVSSTVMDVIAIGYLVNITDGINVSELGEVISIDTTNNQITVSTASDNSYSPATPTYVRAYVMGISNFKHLIANHITYLGEHKIGSTYIPTGTVVSGHYTNVGTTTKKTYIIAEYLY